MCTDNAAMIAAAGWYRLRDHGPSSLDIGAVPNLALVADTVRTNRAAAGRDRR
jgi:tRNA A37 threonylcarbamoyltransferase TsaD